jgi:hypothetical protein
MKILLSAFLFVAACNFDTHFTGDAKFPNGATGCRATCESQGLEFGGFVYSGEYSTSCVCTPRQSAPGASATVSPTAGVIVQAQAAAAAAANQQMMMAQQQQQQMRR